MTPLQQLTVADYEAALADHRRLVRELDVALNGEEGAARQASLCDIIGQVKRESAKARPPAHAPEVEQIGRLLPLCRPAHVTHQIGKLLDSIAHRVSKPPASKE